MSLKDIQEKIGLVVEYCDLWNKYFRLFAEDQESVDDSAAMETEFGAVTQQLAIRHYRLTESLHQEFSDGSKILTLLQNVNSLKYLKSIPDTEFDRHQIQWHEIFLNLNKARGKLEHSVTPEELQKIRAAQAAPKA